MSGRQYRRAAYNNAPRYTFTWEGNRRRPQLPHRYRQPENRERLNMNRLAFNASATGVNLNIGRTEAIRRRVLYLVRNLQRNFSVREYARARQAMSSYRQHLMELREQIQNYLTEGNNLHNTQAVRTALGNLQRPDMDWENVDLPRVTQRATNIGPRQALFQEDDDEEYPQNRQAQRNWMQQRRYSTTTVPLTTPVPNNWYEDATRTANQAISLAESYVDANNALNATDQFSNNTST